MNIKRSIDEVVERVNAPTPVHFQRLIRFGLGLIILGLVLIFLAALFPIPAFLALEKIADKIIYIGGSIAGISITARDDKK